ncbi:MAG: hypothetical protein N3G22_02070 [Candidatus Micrarchaeota archaeon]|nr:hypothetical protein [Candidatus Micrarchaeota archaeon]
MALDDLLISTGVDQLIKLIKEHGRIEITAAAREMKQPVRTIEDWARVLEEEGLISVEYKLTKVYLVWRMPSQEQVYQMGEKLDIKAGQAKEEIDLLLSKVQKGEEELAGIEEILKRVESAASVTPADIEKMKLEIAALQRKYSAMVKSSSERLARLRKRLDETLAQAERKKGERQPAELEKELQVLRSFEATIQSQLSDNETFFEAFEARVEDFRKRIEERKANPEIEALKSELKEVRNLRSELMSAIEIVVEEQKGINEKIAVIEEKISEIAQQESEEGIKKRLSDLKKMRSEAKKQYDIINEHLSDALSSLKKHISKMEAMARQGREIRAQEEEIKREYIDLAEEIARANEEIAAKEKEMQSRFSYYLQEAGGNEGGMAKINEEELQRIASLVRDLQKEHRALEDRIRALQKEAEVIKMISEPGGKPLTKEEKDRSVAFIERIKLSQAEEDEFERKREELRALIHKMWEESKGS